MKPAVLLTLLVACGRLNFEPFGAADGSAMRDGGGGGGMTDGNGSGAACLDPGNGCAFDGVGPCSCWGTPSFTNAGLSENNGALHITPNANTIGAQGACTKNAVPFGAAGVIIEVSSVVAGAQGLTALQLGSNPDVFEIDIQNGLLKTNDGSNTSSNTFDPVAMRWWRIRPVPNGTEFATSPDGKSWSSSTTSGRAASTSYTVKIIGGTPGAVAAPGSAVIEGINVCPP